jgi:hypothetical protein
MLTSWILLARFRRRRPTSPITRHSSFTLVWIAVSLRSAMLAVPTLVLLRLFYGGRIISQTGGHGDFRHGDRDLEAPCCGCHADHLSVLADGVDAVRRAVREELRRGASHIKLMASGGVASPTDPLDRCQYSDEEIRVAVDEATRAGSYVVTHCYPAEAIRRSAALGVPLDRALHADRCGNSSIRRGTGCLCGSDGRDPTFFAGRWRSLRLSESEYGEAQASLRSIDFEPGDDKAGRCANGFWN